MRLEISSLCKSFGAHAVLDSVSLSAHNIRSLVLIGPSGGGKSTLLRVLAGLEQPDSGTATFGDEKVRCELEWRRSVGVVFQAFNLFPHLTAEQNITLPLCKVHGYAPDAATDTAEQVLRRFRLEDHAHKRPAELSGGQKQRIAIARAVAIKPKLLLFDEPTSALDPEMTGEVLDLIQELKAEQRDFVLVTHQMGFAREVGDHIAFLADGKIVESGPPSAVFDHSKTASCRDFLARVLRY